MGEVDINHVKPEPEFGRPWLPHDEFHKSNLGPLAWDVGPRDIELGDNRSPNPSSTVQSGSSILESPAEDTSLSGSPMCPAPICRQFWKAGNYDGDFPPMSRVQNSQNYLHVHPKFLHSNATSHKWAFGAIAELVDNAIDEIQNGATFVIVDKISNARDGSPALLIQDDGGGMDPEAIRRCMSFGFSDKKSKSTIGQYGNGFKTSTMRLGADVIVFSRRLDNGRLTQSIGLLSYTYLSRTGLDRIVVPMVDYEYNRSMSTFEPLTRYGKEHFLSNISILLRWSPYSSEPELMKQFDDIGYHGTKVIVYNLWFANDGNLELDFKSDPEDVRLQVPAPLKKGGPSMSATEEHIGNQYRSSLRAYLSILYLRMPQNFCITLRGKVVEHHNIAQGLKFPEFILYKPQTAGTKEGEVVTTIGFLKEAPHVNIHGFNVYHKNRLVLPFWPVVSYGATSRGRGIVGVLEANFIEPTHNKQDFERTSLFQKLETRLKDMTWEYWDYHCGLIGYQVLKKTRVPTLSSGTSYAHTHTVQDENLGRQRSSNLGPNPVVDTSVRRVVQNTESRARHQGVERMQDDFVPSGRRGSSREARERPNGASAGVPMEIQSVTDTARPANLQDAVMEGKRLEAECLQHKKTELELRNKYSMLRRELDEAQQEYLRMFDELQSLEAVKPDKKVSESPQEFHSGTVHERRQGWCI